MELILKINLTDYISTFAAFDLAYSAVSPVNPLFKAKDCYKKTKEFVASLEEEHFNQFPELKVIKITLNDFNELAANLACVQTGGILKLHQDLDLDKAQINVKISHNLAKSILKDEYKYNQFVESIKNLISEINELATKPKIFQLDEKQRLDSVDIELLKNSSIKLGFHDRFFGGTVNINAKTERSNVSLFANGDFNDLANKPMEIKGQSSLLTAVETLQCFLDRLDVVEHRFGINMTEEPSSTYIPRI